MVRRGGCGVRRAPRGPLGRGDGAARLHLAAHRTRPRPGDARRRQHLAEGRGDHAGRRPRRCAVREGQRLGSRRHRAARPAGGRPGAPAAAAHARRAVRPGDGEPAPHQPVRCRCAEPVGRDAAARLPPASLHRSHARRHRAGRDQPAARGAGRHGRRGVRRALERGAVRHAGLRARQAGGGGVRA